MSRMIGIVVVVAAIMASAASISAKDWDRDRVIHEWENPVVVELDMDPVRGRQLYVSKGCISCHSINGVGGHGDATNLDASTMDPEMNPFDFAAKMWSAAPAMILAQEEELEDGQIQLTGEELADIIAFVHSEEAQRDFGRDDITPEAHDMMHDAEHD